MVFSGQSELPHDTNLPISKSVLFKYQLLRESSQLDELDVSKDFNPAIDDEVSHGFVEKP